MSEVYWQAKIWGLLHDPILKGLHNNTGRGDNSFWLDLEAMADWKENNWNPEAKSGKIFKHLKNADFITSASDRGAIANLTTSVNYDKEKGIEISHLLSGEKQFLRLPDTHHQELTNNRKNYLQSKEQELRNKIPSDIRNDPKRLFWWLWRCLPEETCKLFDDESLLLMPAETRFPDASIWSHATLTSALAGSFIGYDATSEILAKNWPANAPLPHAYLTIFSFSPVQELIKASRKMRDFWAGSWLLHYLSARVCWILAQKYGPDCFLYPSLFQQPLIDHWIREEFGDWVNPPSERRLLTAGFPNVLLLILPKEKVADAMQMAQQTLVEEWQKVSHLVFEHLEQRHWTGELRETDPTWQGWLKAQWQTYWSAVPIGREGEELKSSEIYQEDSPKVEAEKLENDKMWCEIQNATYGLSEKEKLFLEEELNFLRATGKLRKAEQGRNPCGANIGSWWAAIFDQTRFSLAAIKNARSWDIPTAFGPRSTISGLGPVVYPQQEKKRNKNNQHKNNQLTDWVTEGETPKQWKRDAGLFDGIEELNATETVKRCLQNILPQLLKLEGQKIGASYPDLTAGVAGYLKQATPEQIDHFHGTCQALSNKILKDNRRISDAVTQDWGIPWIDEENPKNIAYHPRFLNAGWLVEELALSKDEEQKLSAEEIQSNRREFQRYRAELQQEIDKNYPNNNPANWYVIVAGDGDGMSEWLKGKKMRSYGEYFPTALDVPDSVKEEFKEFKGLDKRMGPSTHSALSRALLDFSNQLLPYLTEQRYAGRLIYGGGDDVLAYTNLWEWDDWLWDVRQCFKGGEDPKGEFEEKGNYWQMTEPKKGFPNRPLFTMGEDATISFGVVMAHHSVPLAIALENLWEAESEAKDHVYEQSGKEIKKDAVQVRVLYGNGNILKATSKFKTFDLWRGLLDLGLEPALFEGVAQLWEQHPIPKETAIKPWVQAFVSRREVFKGDKRKRENFTAQLAQFLREIWLATDPKDLEQEVKNWFKLAAFVVRNREIE
ncbi:type III-B CRISPR-associated protein Cas10/Cmr2 [Spirulina subsalsa]|uniref:type III-B CRISPR-associated protein Cas10/Cmr2 n=1 Tax=Spirulina subsalsa TaxID=54311 RepID=UPI0002D6B808|nr:type III-B CRISPR-associated protein Cas10/Cmr2 [Spirulina subsalsa]